MNKFKKFASLLLAMVMALALAAPAFAADDGKITITNATVGKEYTLYKIFDATYTGTGDDATASYTIDSASAWYNIVTAEGSPFALTQVNGGTTYNVSVKKGEDGKDLNVVDWLQKLENIPDADATETANSDTVEFTGLAMGYYLVKSSLGATITLTNAQPNATVVDKNQKPSGFEKTITGGTVTATVKDENGEDKVINSVEIGKEVTYSITYTTTNFDGDEKITEYIITDNMPANMNLVPDSITVKIGEGESATALENPNITYGGEGDDFSFKITIPWVENTGKENKYEEASFYDSPNKITVTYKGVLTANSTVDTEDGNVNTAKVEYNKVKKDGTPGEPGEDESHETVYTYALAIKKVNEKGEPLEGVKFELTQNGEEVKVSLGSDGYYVVDPSRTSDDENVKLNEVVTNAKGEIVIKGVSGDKYTLTETYTLPGYNKLTEAKEITPVLIGSQTTNKYWKIEEDGTITDLTTSTDSNVSVELSDLAATSIVVVNTTGTLLPSTGGIGTTIFYIVGGVLAAGAVILLITKRRMNIDKD